MPTTANVYQISWQLVHICRNITQELSHKSLFSVGQPSTKVADWLSDNGVAQVSSVTLLLVGLILRWVGDRSQFNQATQANSTTVRLYH